MITTISHNIMNVIHKILYWGIGKCPQLNHIIETSGNAFIEDSTLLLVNNYKLIYSGNSQTRQMTECVCVNKHSFEFDFDISSIRKIKLVESNDTLILK